MILPFIKKSLHETTVISLVNESNCGEPHSILNTYTIYFRLYQEK